MNNRVVLLASLAAFSVSVAYGQEDKKTPPAAPAVKPATTAPVVAEPWADVLSNLTPRSVGPVTMGGRIADISVYERDPRIFYVASASGGLFKTVNGGTTFSPVFERESSISLGAVAVAQSNPDIVYVGSGEASSRNSVAWGDGVYKSTDGGKTWTNLGLKGTLQIGKIVVDPNNPDHVLVAAVGSVWGPSSERGVYRSEDGGKTWKPVLQVDEKTGAIDLKADPKNPKNLLCAMWQRIRKPYDFASGGPGSGLYRSTDGGKNWHRVTQGLPTSALGRIGFSFYRKDPKIVVATVEYKPDPKEKGRPRDGGQVANYAGGTFRSTDGGESWKQINPINPRPFYFSLPVVDPNDDKRIYVFGDNINLSVDGGKTFKPMSGRVHPDFHAVWVNPNDSNNILVGCDGGVNVSRDKGETWDMLNGMAIGQFYAVAVDMRKPYWIYGGLQDNQCWGIPTQTNHGGVSFFDSVGLGGGDGFHVAVDPTDWSTVYSESQGGSAGRVDLRTGQQRSIQPRIAGEKIRFNWSTPFILSPHNPRTIYFGGNRLFKSVNRGDSYRPISPDLTTNDKFKLDPGKLSVTPENTGAEMHCTIITISESPRKPGLLWVGTDDGLVHVSQDDGATWTNVRGNIPGVPAGTWCSRVLASKWVEGRAYATFDGHRSNDFKPYVFKTDDFGKTWTPLSTGLPDYDCVYVIAEGEQNPDLLYLGSEMSLRASLDLGKTWGRIRNKFPTVAVHDLVVHPRDLDLVIGTHGRSIWTLDVTGLESLTGDARKESVVVAKPQNVLLLGRIGGGQWEGDRVVVARNSQPGTRVSYWLAAPAKEVKIKISGPDGKDSEDLTGDGAVGLNVVSWSGRINGRLASAGDYRVEILVDGKSYTTTLRVEEAFLNKG